MSVNKRKLFSLSEFRSKYFVLIINFHFCLFNISFSISWWNFLNSLIIILFCIYLFIYIYIYIYIYILNNSPYGKKIFKKPASDLKMKIYDSLSKGAKKYIYIYIYIFWKKKKRPTLSYQLKKVKRKNHC